MNNITIGKWSIATILFLILMGWQAKLFPYTEPVSASNEPAVTNTPTPSPTSDMGQITISTNEEGELDYKDEYVKNIKDFVYQTFGEKGNIAWAIAESECNHTRKEYPRCVNSTEVEHSIGIFQISIARDFGKGAWVHWNKIPGDTLEEKEEWLKDPFNNTLMARFIYGTSGFYPWSVFKNGVYLDKLE